MFGAAVKAVTKGTHYAEPVSIADVTQNVRRFTHKPVDQTYHATLSVHPGNAQGTAQQRRGTPGNLHVDKLARYRFRRNFRCNHVKFSCDSV